MLQIKPAAPAVLDALDKILASETFSRSERARKLLRYLVEQEQAGEADRLKGFTIAVDVFGRDADFDSSADAVVRVQARRLRDLLKQYSETEGADDPLRVVIPRGSYVPVYGVAGKTEEAIPIASRVEAAASPPLAARATMPLHAPSASEARVMRHLRLFWAAMVVIIAMLGFVTFRLLTADAAGDAALATDTGMTTTGDVAAAVSSPVALPTVHVISTANDEAVARVAALLRGGLAGFDTIDMIARDPDAEDGTPISPLQFVFEVTPGSVTGSVTIDLKNSASAKLLVSQTLAPADLNTVPLDDRLADLLSATIPVSGALYGFIEQNRLASGLVECLLLNDRYYLDQMPQKHEAAYRCFSDLAESGIKSPLIYAELASLLQKAISERYDFPADRSPEKAMTLAYRGVLTGPTSPYAHRSYGYVNSSAGNTAEAIRFMRKAYELNTYDLSMAAAYGYALIFSGDYKTGVPIMRRAVEASSAHPNWWDYGLFIAEFMIGNDDRASTATDALVSTKKAHYLAARLIAATSAGNAELAKSLADEIVTDFPDFAANPRLAFEKANYPADLVEKLATTIRASGLANPS
ncbi:hypothetical protein [Mesorhizobium sp. KR2-14]|uniref:tetratricopeptide repeat protein n=1 Tax=Mesorhizobium sp. KR2-14 TaxID=3156610 RepID=UPI0032B3C731